MCTIIGVQILSTTVEVGVLCDWLKFTEYLNVGEVDLSPTHKLVGLKS